MGKSYFAGCGSYMMCISRQLWWGKIRSLLGTMWIGQIYVGKDEAEVRLNNNLAGGYDWTQDEDVLTLGSLLHLGLQRRLPEETQNSQNSVSLMYVTVSDIISSGWPGMIMMTLKFTD